MSGQQQQLFVVLLDTELSRQAGKQAGDVCMSVAVRDVQNNDRVLLGLSVSDCIVPYTPLLDTLHSVSLNVIIITSQEQQFHYNLEDGVVIRFSIHISFLSSKSLTTSTCRINYSIASYTRHAEFVHQMCTMHNPFILQMQGQSRQIDGQWDCGTKCSVWEGHIIRK